MTVDELIRELQRHPPSKPVRVVMSEVEHHDEAGSFTVYISDDEAAEADDVRNEGPYILIRGK